MKRREMLLLAACAVVTRPMISHASSPIIGFLGSGSPSSYTPFVAAFREGLSETGLVEGQNVAVEFRWAENSFDRLPALAADLVERKVDVIATSGGTPSAHAAKSATSTIPIVFSGVADPVGAGLLVNLDRPEANITGISDVSSKLTSARLELVSELVPRAKTIGLLVNPHNPVNGPLATAVMQTASKRDVQPTFLFVDTDRELEDAVSSAANQGIGALVVASGSFFASRREQLVALVASHGVPTIYSLREFAMAGGLISYGPSITDTYRELALYVGKILKGTKPLELAVHELTKFELVINLKTAKALGLTVPQSLRDRAELIQ